MYLSLQAVMAHNWDGRAVVLVKTLRRLPRLSTEDFFFFFLAKPGTYLRSPEMVGVIKLGI
jgi:hypothetical protein